MTVLLQHPDLIEKRRKALADTLASHLDGTTRSNGSSSHGGSSPPEGTSPGATPARRNGGGIPLSPRPTSGPPSPSKPAAGVHEDGAHPHKQQQNGHQDVGMTAAEAAVGVSPTPTPVHGGAAAGVHADTASGGPLQSAGGQVQ